MKKFITFALAALVIFAMCSCQPVENNLGDKVAFTVRGVDESFAKAITATDEGKENVKTIQLAFIPSEQESDRIICEYKIGTADAVLDAKSASSTSVTWHDDLILWDETNKVGTWNTNAQLYLSQGKWTIRAQALDANKNVLFEGEWIGYVNKKTTSCTIKLDIVESEEVGVLKFTSVETSNVNGEAEGHRVYWELADISNTVVKSGYFTKYTFNTDKTKVVYTLTDTNTSEFEVPQGQYELSMKFEQNVGTVESPSWESGYTGKDKKILRVFHGYDTEVTAYLDPKDAQNTTIGAEIEEALISVTLANVTEDTVNVSSGTYSATVKATVALDGATFTKLTIYNEYDDGTTDITSLTDGVATQTLTLGVGNYDIIAIAYGTDSEGNTIKSVESKVLINTAGKL